MTSTQKPFLELRLHICHSYSRTHSSLPFLLMWQPNVSIFVDVAPSSLVPTWIGARNDPNTPVIFFLPLNLSSHYPCHGGMPLSREGADREEVAAVGHGAATARPQEMRRPQGGDDPTTGSDAGHGEAACRPLGGRAGHGEAAAAQPRGGDTDRELRRPVWLCPGGRWPCPARGRGVGLRSSGRARR
jgi:hypothetical protein